MEQFLERHDPPKLTQGERDTTNRHTTSIKDTESVINNLPKHEAPGRDDFNGEFHQMFKEEMLSIFYNLFQKIKEGDTSNSFCEVSITLILK